MPAIVVLLLIVVLLGGAMGLSPGEALFGFIFLCIAGGVAIFLIRIEIHKAAIAQIEVDGRKIIEEHKTALVRRYRQLVRPDDYGHADMKDWYKERERFYRNITKPALSSNLWSESLKSYFLNDLLDPIVRRAVEQERLAFAKQFDPDVDPIDYEHFCAERLRALGWDARVTKAAGDQGADIVATKEGSVMVVQCKRYAKPVGNKAVQEIVGALKFYDAQHALVVATGGFTKSATALAAVNNVILSHHDDIAGSWCPS